MSYEVLDLEELEQLARVGGSEDYEMGTNSVAVPIITSIAVSELVTAVTAVTAASVSWSALFSCTKNKKACQRK